MKNYLLLSVLLLSFVSFSQDEALKYYDTEIIKHLKKFNSKNEIAIKENNSERVEYLFDSLFNTYLKDTYIRNVELRNAKTGKVKLDKINKPILLLTKSSWHPIEEDELELINNLATLYRDKIAVIVLYWTDPFTAKRYVKHFNKNVTVAYVDESRNKENNFIRAFKHSFGSPSCFLISHTKQLISIKPEYDPHYLDTHQNEIIAEFNEATKAQMENIN